MIIGGIQWTTLLDYPDRIAATVFTSGCNFRCPFCHNPELVLPELVSASCTALDETFFDQLKERSSFLDAVVISGGEPTLQPDLVDVMSRIKALGYLVKLDTNGTRPSLIQEIIDRGLVDFVAMDIKAPKGSYAAMSGVASVDVETIKRAIEVIKASGVAYEFRTTAAPGLSVADLLGIGRWLADGRAYWLQAFQAPACKALVDETIRDRPALRKTDLEAVWSKLRDRFEMGGVRS